MQIVVIDATAYVSRARGLDTGQTVLHVGVPHRAAADRRAGCVSPRPNGRHAKNGIALAEHHHFESITEAITSGADIVPKVSNLRVYDPHRLIADTEEGEALRGDIAALEKLLLAYQEGALLES